MNGGSFSYGISNTVGVNSPGKMKKPEDQMNAPSVSSGNHMLHNRMTQNFNHNPHITTKRYNYVVFIYDFLKD